jgi:hypothetical protein
MLQEMAEDNKLMEERVDVLIRVRKLHSSQQKFDG